LRGDASFRRRRETVHRVRTALQFLTKRGRKPKI